ncbi:hypothetical protein FRC07_009094 [Ceratobasidium sp. 392]|nr:hypothetical protein FRC07_009094 [Ceratobasidium sp. 392]
MVRRNVAELTLGGISVGIVNEDGSDYIDGYMHKSVTFEAEPHIPSRLVIFQQHQDSLSGSMIEGAGLWANVRLENSANLTSEFWPATELKAGNNDFEITSYYAGDERRQCPLRFTQRNITEEISLKDERLDESWLGSILVEVCWAVETSETPEEAEQSHKRNLELERECDEIVNTPLNERISRAEHVLGVEYAPHKARDVLEKMYQAEKVGNEEFRFAFKYRPIEWLVAQKIAPRSHLPRRLDNGLLTPSPNIKREEPDSCTLSMSKATRASKRLRRE